MWQDFEGKYLNRTAQRVTGKIFFNNVTLTSQSDINAVTKNSIKQHAWQRTLLNNVNGQHLKLACGNMCMVSAESSIQSWYLSLSLTASRWSKWRSQYSNNQSACFTGTWMGYQLWDVGLVALIALMPPRCKAKGLSTTPDTQVMKSMPPFQCRMEGQL